MLQKVPSKCALAPGAAELGEIRDAIRTDSGHSNCLDYVVVIVHAAQQRVKNSFHRFTAPLE